MKSTIGGGVGVAAKHFLAHQTMPRTAKQAASRHDFFSPAWQRAARKKLLAWYHRQKRDLPWRGTADPYAIWISEIMLQQTQVATVRNYFSRFLAAFPTIADLAAAPEQRVLRLWEGLGYYRRARQLHAAAKQIVTQHGGRFPRDFSEIRALPGIGRYTAGAIASIAFDQRQPILEANTIRLFARLLKYRSDTKSAAGLTLLWRAAEEFLPQRGSGDVNQALMELGSQVCTPRTPRCDVCPLKELCPTRAAGLQNEIPTAKKKAAFEELREAAVLVRRNGAVLLRRCQPGERWAGLWDFPRVPFDGDEKQLADNVRKLTGATIDRLEPFLTLRHTVTRYRITLEAFTAACRKFAPRKNDASETRWVSREELAHFPLNTTGRKLAQRLLSGKPL